MNSWFHAVSAARKWGGIAEEYLLVEEFIDSSKKVIGDVRHRSLYHHTLGVWLCEEIFGPVLHVGTAHGSVREVPVRLVAERHIEEDLGWIPSPADYIQGMPISPWMSGKRARTADLATLGLVTPQEQTA
jgi:hypothetical protein